MYSQYFKNHNVRKRTFWKVRQRKSRMSLRICVVWSEFSFSSRKFFVFWLFKIRPVEILITLCEYAGWSGSGRTFPKVRFLTSWLIGSFGSLGFTETYLKYAVVLRFVKIHICYNVRVCVCVLCVCVGVCVCVLARVGPWMRMCLHVF